MAANLSDSTPAAPSGSSNVKWQKDGSGNISAYVPPSITLTTPTLVTPTLGAALATSINFGGQSLSAYAEGTWSPSFTGLTGGGTPTGTYTRIGRLVFITINIPASGTCSSTANTTHVTNLPFTAAVDAGCIATDDAVNNFGVGWVRNASTQLWTSTFSSGNAVHISAVYSM